ncbi:MAG: penicillin acylase family protein [Bryobacterales bacterium]|nr:penicillin acylase family protein [Bryobacterales bacterium]
MVIRLLCLLLAALSAHSALRDDVSIRRDTYGIPHILGRTEEAASFGLGYAQAEDHATEIARRLVAARGQAHQSFDGDIENDFRLLRFHNPEAAAAAYRSLSGLYRKIIDAYVAGVNHYVRQHRASLPAWVPEFTGADILAATRAGAVLAAASTAALPTEDGSNAFALHGSRTVSGKPILLGNPHLQWNALYWEAHVTVPGKINFYGSTLPGIPVLRAGFNDRLGWVTTNNAPDLVDVFEFPLDPKRPGHYLFEGKSLPLRSHTVRIGGQERTYHDAHIGPVLRLDRTRVFAVKSAGLDAIRYYEAFYRLAKTKNLAEFRKVLDRNLSPTSNITYADADGYIFYIWNARLPRRPDDGTDYRKPVPGEKKYIWTRFHPVRELPQMMNPRGGYVMNSNDAPWFTNLEDPLDPARFPSYVERGELRMRSQVILRLLRGGERFSLEDIWRLKSTNQVLLADRVKAGLIAATRPHPDLRDAAGVLEQWDNHVNTDSRGAVLFAAFADRYLARTKTPYETPWEPARPIDTPAGIGDPEAALTSLREAVEEVRKAYGSLDVAWGEVHRFRFRGHDLPADGAKGAHGVYRVMGFGEAEDGKRVAGWGPSAAGPLTGSGDAWVLTVEFTQPVRAYSVVAYGQTTNPESPHCCDQIALFARRQLRKAWFTEEEIRANLEREYRP